MIDFDYLVRKSPRRKTISITVYPDNRVLVAAPSKMSQKSVLDFLEAKSDWVRRNISYNLEKARRKAHLRFIDGEKVLYLGNEYVLRIEEATPEGVFLKDGEMRVRLDGAGAGESRSELVRNRLLAWYVDRARVEIEKRIHTYGKRIGVMPISVTIKKMRCRWGSCSVRGRINLAWNIIMAPEKILDYLVVHELCHLVHNDHSKEYWSLVASFLPDCRASRKWLRENGQLLSF